MYTDLEQVLEALTWALGSLGQCLSIHWCKTPVGSWLGVLAGLKPCLEHTDVSRGSMCIDSFIQTINFYRLACLSMYLPGLPFHSHLLAL